MLFRSLNTDFESIYDVYTNQIQKPIEKVVCLRCGRPLTNEKSRQARLGPKCARKLAYETRTRFFSAKTLQHYNKIQRTSHEDNIPTKNISLYYTSHSSHKPYCKIGAVSLPITDNCIADTSGYQKKTYSLPLFEGVIYEIGICLPQVRVFLLQVQDQQLRDISNSMH